MFSLDSPIAKRADSLSSIPRVFLCKACNKASQDEDKTGAATQETATPNARTAMTGTLTSLQPLKRFSGPFNALIAAFFSSFLSFLISLLM